MLAEWPSGGNNPNQFIDSDPPGGQSFHPGTKSLQADTVDHSSSPIPPAKPNLPNPLKRLRTEEETDVEEDGISQRKKRRLRLDLVTSRLSRPYADPATHIIGTKAGRSGAWARQRFVGGKLLRKAAVFNQMALKRRREMLESTRAGENRAKNGEASSHSNKSEAQASQRSPAHLAAPQITLDYNAFDFDGYNFDQEEDEDAESEDDCSEEDSNAIYCDFGSLDSSDTDPEFFDTSWSFVDTSGPEFNRSGSEIEMVLEYERKDEVSIAPAKIDGISSIIRIPVA